MLYFVKTPLILKRLFSNLTWSITTNKKELYLTFDDGPTPQITEWVLEQLKLYNAKATFFCIGKNVEHHPDIFTKIITEGHSIGNHTQNHTNCWKTSKKTYLKDVDEAQQVINSTINNQQSESVNLFRPPYGKITPKRAKQLLKKGYNIIMWDVLSADFDTKISPEKCLENVIKNTKKGSIIVFHDSNKAYPNLQVVLPKTLEYFSNIGYQFKNL